MGPCFNKGAVYYGGNGVAAGVYSGWSHGIAVREQIMLVPYSLILIQLVFNPWGDVAHIQGSPQLNLSRNSL